MPLLPVDYLVDILRIDLAHMGCSRVILLGSADEMESGGLRTGLARWGFTVLVPPQGARAWIADLARESDVAGESVDRLRTLLADGLEHGVEAIVTTSKTLASYVLACGIAVPTLVATPRGSAVPIRNIVFDMGGVLFKWDPLAMSARVCENEEDAHLLAKAVFGSVEWAWQDAGAVDDKTVAFASKTRVPQRLYAAVDELVHHWHDHREPVDGIEELIRGAKDAGLGVYLLSNAGESFAAYESQLPAYECFDGKVISCYEHVVKPDARIYHTLLDRYDLRPEECLFVDDTKLNVFAARRVGMRAYRFDGNVTALREILLG